MDFFPVQWYHSNLTDVQTIGNVWGLSPKTLLLYEVFLRIIDLLLTSTGCVSVDIMESIVLCKTNNSMTDIKIAQGALSTIGGTLCMHFVFTSHKLLRIAT